MSDGDRLAAEVERAFAMAHRLKYEEAHGWPLGFDMDRIAREWNAVLWTLGEAVDAAPEGQRRLLTRVYTQNLDAPLPPDAAPPPELAPPPRGAAPVIEVVQPQGVLL